MKLLKIANNSTPYDFMKAVLNNSKVQKNNDPALQKLGDNIDLFIKTQEQKMLENKEAFGTEYRKILDSQPLKAPLQDILFWAINEQKLTPEEVNALSISTLLPKLFETGRSAAPDAISKKWYEGVVKIIGERLLDERMNSFRPLLEKALEPIANSNDSYDKNIKEAVDRFCNNKVIKTYPDFIDQILERFRGRLCELINDSIVYDKGMWKSPAKIYFEKRKYLLYYFSGRPLGIKGFDQKEFYKWVSGCENLLYEGRFSSAFEPVLSIILGVAK